VIYDVMCYGGGRDVRCGGVAAWAGTAGDGSGDGDEASSPVLGS
jgi:hypothetical protein